MLLQGSSYQYFTNLGASVESLWRKQDYDEAAFPAVAEKVLRDNPPSENVSFWDTVKFAFLTEPLPEQADIEASFGQPPLTVYWQPEFRIELLFWIVGLPGIHQHAFSGAFHVLDGSSLHSEWEFEQEERVVARLLLGRMQTTRVELLCKGDTRAIEAGAGFIHATYHLDRPTVSVVVRTNQEDNQLPQYLYYPPSIAIASSRPGPAIRRRKQMIRMLARAGRQRDLLEVILHFVETADAFSTFHCIFESCAFLTNAPDRSRLLLAAARRHPKLVDAIRPALLTQERRDRISAMRQRVSNPDLQFFLALLLNVPDQTSIFDLVRARHTRADAVETVIRCVVELSTLGLLDVRLLPQNIQALRGLLSGKTKRDIIETLVDTSGQGRISEEAADKAIETTHHYWLFAPLFGHGHLASQRTPAYVPCLASSEIGDTPLKLT